MQPQVDSPRWGNALIVCPFKEVETYDVELIQRAEKTGSLDARVRAFKPHHLNVLEGTGPDVGECGVTDAREERAPFAGYWYRLA